MKLAFDDAGRGDCVVLIHGHPFDRTLWAPQLAALSGDFRVIAPDLRGFGRSPVTPHRVTMREYAADLEDLLDSLEIARAAIVGLSMGGLVAMELAAARPDRYWAIGLVAATMEPPTAGDRATRLERAAAVECDGMAVLVDYMPPASGPSCPPSVRARVDAMMDAAPPAGAAAALRGRAERPDYRPLLADLDVGAGLRGLGRPVVRPRGDGRDRRLAEAPDDGRSSHPTCPTWRRRPNSTAAPAFLRAHAPG